MAAWTVPVSTTANVSLVTHSLDELCQISHRLTRIREICIWFLHITNVVLMLETFQLNHLYLVHKANPEDIWIFRYRLGTTQTVCCELRAYFKWMTDRCIYCLTTQCVLLVHREGVQVTLKISGFLSCAASPSSASTPSLPLHASVFRLW